MFQKIRPAMAEVRLDPAEHAWMTDAKTREVLAALNSDGQKEDRTRFVGGCVRNALLGEPVDDVDIATTLTPDETLKALEAASIKAVPTGIAHGTITAVVDGEPFEITSLRKDVETFGRRAAVAFTKDWKEDALRRDFRLNAIYASPDGALYDPFGGLDDVADRQIVFIGEARDRIGEDHLRILRFYRFTAWYGRQIDPAGHAACMEMADTLNDLSVERVWKELKKLLAAPNPSSTVKAMQEGHVLKCILTGDIDFNLFLAIINADRGKSRSPEPLVRLAALLGRDGAAMASVCEQMKASNAERDRCTAMTASAESFGVAAVRPGFGERERSALLYHMGPEAFRDQMRLAEAAGEGDADADLAAAAQWQKPRFPITGQDLAAAGVPRGPQMGQQLNALEAIWVDSGFTLTRANLLERLDGGTA
ncbi:CCA tRNA nucleotidyltransferase [Maricaulaceae bacterium NA33B04]|nr:CCA tRNA nucleotidyltransferase [Maricaulaceae bacterium NA33B04]